MATFDDGIADTQFSTSGIIETEVLIIGSGPAGSSAALFLSTLGVANILITKYRWTANTPRAHITNQRTMEIFRDVGIEAQVIAEATPHALMGDTVFCTSITGEELGRIRTFGTHPTRHAEFELASPNFNCDIPQTYLEPILVKNAAARGTQVRFSTEYLSQVQDADGVTVTVLDRLSGTELTIRAKYLIGADGARSKVAEDIDLPMVGEMDIAGSMNITFTADIAPYVNHRPSVLYWVIQPGSNVGGIGTGLVRMIRPWDQWLVVWGYDIKDEPPILDTAAATQIVRNLLGMPDLDVEITGSSLWGNNEQYATVLQRDRVFCVGDAIHRHPPSNGLGSNTSIQDSYNLAWKIALVLAGRAGSKLLDTYSVERAPIAKQVVVRSNQSAREFSHLFDALGVSGDFTEEEMLAHLEDRKSNTPEGATKRAAIAEAMEIKNFEFNAHGVEIGQFYESDAIVADGGARPAPTRDPELYFEASTFPGSHLPHAWVGDSKRKVSTLDLAPFSRFTLFTGITGEAWANAVTEVADRLDISMATIIIGPGRDADDLYFDWSKIREIAEDGAILVRPDKHIAWRCDRLLDNAAELLERVMLTLLDRTT